MFFRKSNRTEVVEGAVEKVAALDLLIQTPGLGRMDYDQRRDMTVSCKDTDYIPKVSGAGSIKTVDGRRVQLMHNGIVVAADGYAGKWMTEIITALGGHHEPQEEKVFFEVLKRLGADATMIELGAWWSYYSLWFNKHVDNPKNICGEPDETNLKLGQLNARLNNIQDIDFLQVASGGDDGQEITIRSDSDNTKMIKVKVRTVDSLMEEKSIERLDILHMDVQGFEFDSLHGAEKSITSGKVRFVFVSTHHYIFSKSPTTHADCIKLIQDWGGHIISSHTIHESFSGDGLIVASFFDEDKDFSVSTSLNHTDQALFRSYEQDLGILVESYDKLIG
jgi:FkbM family methyltransferase